MDVERLEITLDRILKRQNVLSGRILTLTNENRNLKESVETLQKSVHVLTETIKTKNDQLTELIESKRKLTEKCESMAERLRRIDAIA